MKKKWVTWEQVEEFVNYIVSIYKDSDLTGVYGLPRGGLVLAVMLSHRLHIPFLGSPCKDCLIVDDICDSGESLLHYAQNSSSFEKPLYHIVTMYYKENKLGITPEKFYDEKGDDWIVFPWEV